MKAWEISVETLKEPDKKFDGVYVFQDSSIGDGANRNSVLWKPHLYTINFKHSYICKYCPKVKRQFVDMIYDLLRVKYKKPIYGKIGHSIIKTKKSIEKHFFEISNWDFYYEDGTLAKNDTIMGQIEALNCYLLEEAFDNYFEKNWEKTCNDFIVAVCKGKPAGFEQSERIISKDVAMNMVAAFFIMLCRNPCFDAMGVYARIKQNLLYPIFSSMGHDIGVGEEPAEIEGKAVVDELMEGVWYSELYKIFFKNTGGFYHTVVETVMIECQMILFEADSDAGTFITSDNPAFEHKSVVEIENINGMLFPITPRYMIFLAKGSKGINYIDYRFADASTVKYFNRIIAQHKTKKIIAITKNIQNHI
jgi:hypothetical protein